MLSSIISVHHAQYSIDEMVRSFWELEDIPDNPVMTQEEIACEEIFKQTHYRDKTGRFVVNLPFKQNRGKIGSSVESARMRFKHLERQLARSPVKREQYADFMREFLDLDHMELVPEEEIIPQRNQDVYYLPHHAVLREQSTTTKLRVVFDASATTSTGVSLNDILMVGPKLQLDLIEHLIRFRTHQIALTADIAKMYRQIFVHKPHSDFQRILWRESTESEVQVYRLKTVTYGTASAPYLAIKCLKQLSCDEQPKYPSAASVLSNDFYVDDLMTGMETEEDAIHLQTQLIQLLKRGGFELRKWASNSQRVLDHLPPELQQEKSLRIINDATKTLGINWHTKSDSFFFKKISLSERRSHTKRTILSDIAKIFDPLGWLTPTTIIGKILLQKLWQRKLDWDEELPTDISKEWKNHRAQLTDIEKINIQRCVIISDGIKCELHGFCDASSSAYAAAVYIRSVNCHGRSRVLLLAAKSKVAPLKQITIPRLELCAALLLSKLIKLTTKSLSRTIEEIWAWSDSTIVLAWLSAQPTRWKTFVANRVAKIHQNIPQGQWRHVRSEENPADCASRGISLESLESHELWWNGPKWLNDFEPPSAIEPTVTYEEDVLAEERKEINALNVVVESSLINTYSSLTKLQRVTAWCLRFIVNATKQQTENRLRGPLQTSELITALNVWIKQTQRVEFHTEIQSLQLGKQICSKSKLLCLNPFIDENGLIRVGGRLKHAKISEDVKYPILLPRSSKLTHLIILHEHINNLHSGPQLTLASLQRRYWIICARDVIRHVLKKCMPCFRQRATVVEQMMGNLPARRVNPSRAFLYTGIDYAGPIYTRASKGRGKVTMKSYIALFICFSTRAIHLELVGDLTTDSFLAALKRFISRRGKPLEINSDCGSNFVGADKEIKRMIRSAKHNEMVTGSLNNQNIKWNFNPPAAPHFGGLWEAGVKSVKYHLKRVIGEAKLTFEEMYTVLTQIEACLNSRPLTAISNDPSDLVALTPGHFLIGDALTSVPEPDLTTVKMNHLSRWQYTQKLFQHFWKRWSAEYLSRLQQRPKWWSTKENVNVGDLVLLRDELQPPLKWKLGRIIATHAGTDQLVRVVTVRTANGNVKRPLVKLSPLPIDN